MIFKKIAKSEIKRLFDLLKADYEVVGPVESGEDKNGETIYSFKGIENFSDLVLEYSYTKIPPKKHFLDYNETLTKFHFDKKNDNWTYENVDAAKPIAFIGLHTCDINALNKLDKVLMESEYPAPYYVLKRKNAFIIGIDCMPMEHCFCKSLGTDFATHGYDMFFTAIEDNYFVEILSSEAFQLIQKLDSEDLTNEDHKLLIQKQQIKRTSFETSVDTSDLTKILDMEFKSDKWKKFGDICLGCGTCSRVCPTCYCYGIKEEVSLNFETAEKRKQLYSCNIVDFAEVAGGLNFRPDMATRLKYRYYHKHRGFVEKYEESLCVGCGRCGEQCLSEINVPEVIAYIRGEE